MRILQKLTLTSLLCLGLTGTISAQTPTAKPKANTAASGEEAKESKAEEAKEGPAGEEHHHALSAYHKNAMEHAKALHHHASMHKSISKEVAKEHVEEMGKSLESAKRHHAAIEQVTSGDAKLKPHHDAIHAHHAKATEHQAALKAEVEKPLPDAKAVKEHAAGVHQEIKQAEAEHKAMKSKRKVREPAEPAAQKGAK
jgi:hypothetical protein